MTGLANKTPSLNKAECLDLINKVIYWLQQPEVQTDPTAFALATRTGDLLEHQSRFKDAHLADEVHENEQQLRRGAAKANVRQVALDSGLYPCQLAELPEGCQSAGRRKKKWRRCGQEVAQEVCLGTVSLSAVSLAGCREDLLPDLNPTVYVSATACPDRPPLLHCSCLRLAPYLGRAWPLKGPGPFGTPSREFPGSRSGPRPLLGHESKLRTQ